MIEHGPAPRYLQETCPAADYKICRIAKSLPMTSYELLWATDAYRELAAPLQHDQAARIARIQAASTGRIRPCLRRVAGCATPTGSAGHGSAAASLKLTFHLDHSAGADHRR
jgi:hypothetical protein